MKKNLFEIKSEEILRILSLHEESTKKQYLNVLNEQNVSFNDYDYSNVLTMKDKILPQEFTTNREIELNNNDFISIYLKISAGAKFVKRMKDNVPYLITQPISVKLTNTKLRPNTANGKIVYWCSGNIAGKFQFYTDSTTSKEVTEKLRTQLFYDEARNLSSQLTPICQSELPKTDTTTPKIEPKKIEKGTTSLSDEEKLSKAKKAGYKTWAEYKDNEFAWKGNKTVNRQQQFVQNTVAGIYKLQTDFLGVPTPTGQLTTKDIDTLLTKLQ